VLLSSPRFKERSLQIPSLIEELSLVKETRRDLLTRQRIFDVTLKVMRLTLCLLVMPMYA
jgi:hypothetical protein